MSAEIAHLQHQLKVNQVLKTAGLLITTRDITFLTTTVSREQTR